jgi:hypothetical protein
VSELGTRAEAQPTVPGSDARSSTDPDPSLLNPPRCVCVAGGLQCQPTRVEGSLYCHRCSRHRCMCPCLTCEPWPHEGWEPVPGAIGPSPESPPASRSPSLPDPPPPGPNPGHVMTGMTEVLRISHPPKTRHAYSMFPVFSVTHSDLRDVCSRYDLDTQREMYHSQTRLTDGREAL